MSESQASVIAPLAQVLVVDDDPDVRGMIAWALEEEGLQVSIAADGRQALARFAAARPSLVVLDLGLPGVDGQGVADGLRHAYGNGVPIVVVSADGHAAAKARRAGAHAYLHKPFEIAELVGIVRRLLAA